MLKTVYVYNKRDNTLCITANEFKTKDFLQSLAKVDTSRVIDIGNLDGTEVSNLNKKRVRSCIKTHKLTIEVNFVQWE